MAEVCFFKNIVTLLIERHQIVKLTNIYLKITMFFKCFLQGVDIEITINKASLKTKYNTSS
ncbi:hypothetical protein NBRC116592_30750 [Colwellia sp. KU-HH00111]